MSVLLMFCRTLQGNLAPPPPSEAVGFVLGQCVANWRQCMTSRQALLPVSFCFNWSLEICSGARSHQIPKLMSLAGEQTLLMANG